MIRLAVALFAVQAGFHGFTASLPVALARAGVPDPEIGLIVGVAGIVQIPAAFLAGAILDRLGGIRVFTLGAASYLVGCAILLLPGVEAGGPSLPFLVARVFQGAGLAATLPSALSLVPRLVQPGRQGFGLAVVSSAHNLTLVALPPISLAVLSATSLNGVTLSVVGFVVAGVLVLRVAPLPLRLNQPGESELPANASVAKRRLGFAFRRAWASVLAVVLLYGAHWGVIVAYLPQRAELAGADIGLFFVADGLAILSARVPTGWLADRVRPIVLASAGILLTAAAVALLTLPPATPLLVAAGLLSGSGAGLVMTPMLVELSRRSGDADRGSAFSLFSASLAAALSIGSVGAAPIVGSAGFETALVVSLAGLGLAAVVLVLDRGLRISRPRADSPRPAG